MNIKMSIRSTSDLHSYAQSEVTPDHIHAIQLSRVPECRSHCPTTWEPIADQHPRVSTGRGVTCPGSSPCSNNPLATSLPLHTSSTSGALNSVSGAARRWQTRRRCPGYEACTQVAPTYHRCPWIVGSNVYESFENGVHARPETRQKSA